MRAMQDVMTWRVCVLCPAPGFGQRTMLMIQVSRSAALRSMAA
jgi:hypothetical protein